MFYQLMLNILQLKSNQNKVYPITQLVAAQTKSTEGFCNFQSKK